MTAARLRFAPSPTGQLHVGNARTALFNWLLARRLGGTFILRIEDTDTERSTRVSEAAILADLSWLGLDWDEGPNVGGPHAPYRQSERAARYEAAARVLVASGRAYYCFCTAEALQEERDRALATGQPPRYSGRCRAIDRRVALDRIAGGESPALRFRVPGDRVVRFADLVRGDVAFSTEIIGDPVILRSDRRPAYNFAVVVDDSEMAVTHVVRGEDHLSNTPRQLLLYEALGLTPPVFAHLSMVLGPDHAPLSKRHGATSVAEFRARGFLPEALVNYLALLGWSPGENEELLSVGEMARRFDLAAVSHSAAVFDTGKLAWMNRHYMKEAAPDRLVREALPYFEHAGLLTATPPAAEFVASLLPMVAGSVDRLDEIPDRVSVIFAWDAERAAALVAADPNVGGVVRALVVFADAIGSIGPLDRDAFRAAAAGVRQQTGLKGRDLFHPIRQMLTAADSGPELDLVVPAIDRGAGLPPGTCRTPIASCAERAKAVVARLQQGAVASPNAEE